MFVGRTTFDGVRTGVGSGKVGVGPMFVREKRSESRLPPGPRRGDAGRASVHRCRRCQGAEETVLFAIDAGGEEQGVGGPRGPVVAESQPPQAVNRDGLPRGVLELALEPELAVVPSIL